MKPPICRVCGKAEWSHTCAGASKARDDAVRAATPPRRAAGNAAPSVSSAALVEAPAPDQPPPKSKRAARGSFDRTAYQRDLMRKRRAELKAPSDAN